MACSGRWLPPPPLGSNKWCDTSRNVCAVAELAQLPHPIKNACHVWGEYFRFLVMAGPSGSSEVNTSMSFDKHASHPHAHTHTPRSGVIHHCYWWVHQGAHYPPTPVKLESTYMLLLRLTLEVIVAGAETLILPNDSHSSPGYVFTCGILCASFSKTFCSISPPPPRHFHRDLIKTTFTHSLSSHDCSLSMFTLCNEVSE